MFYPSASLYVGDLATEVSDSDLWPVFSQVGPVQSIRVCRDRITRRSLCYGYVNFQNPEDAERALDVLNYGQVHGKAIRLMWSHRDPSFRKSGVGNVFIKNLDKNIDNKALHDTFSVFGAIRSCKVAVDHKGQSKGYGFVHFETQEAANEAIEKVNGKQLLSKVVFVAPHVPRANRQNMADQLFTNIYVNNLDESFDDNKLSEVFGQFGAITSHKLVWNEAYKSHFAFINYAKPEEAKASIETLNGKEMGGKIVLVGKAQKKDERQELLRQTTQAYKTERYQKYHLLNLFVKNLDDTVDIEKLKQEFSQFGKITSATIMKDATSGLSKGFGFVCYDNQDSARNAIHDMNGKMFGPKPIYVAYAQPKELRMRMHPSGGMHNMPFGSVPFMRYVPVGPGFPMRGAGFPMRGRGGFPSQGFPGRGGPRGPHRMGGAPQQKDMRTGGRGGRGGAHPSQGRQGPNNYKLGNNVKNVGAHVAQNPQQTVQQEQVQQQVISPASLVNLPVEQQKQAVGELLYAQIVSFQPGEVASKVTGVLVESLEVPEMLHLLEDRNELQAQVAEAIKLLTEQQ